MWRSQLISPPDRNFVQGMTAPPVLLFIERALTPDPTDAEARLDVTSLDSNDRVIDGSLGAITGIVSTVESYGTVYDFLLRHDWAVGDLDLTGSYGLQFKVTFSTGEVQVFPQLPMPVMILPREGSGTPIQPSAYVLQEVRVEMVHTFVMGDVIYPTGPETWALADASNFNTLGSAVVTTVEDAGAFWYVGPGALIVFPTDQLWTPGLSLYLDPDNLGKVTQTEPTYLTHPGKWLQNLGSANNSRTWSFQHFPSVSL